MTRLFVDTMYFYGQKPTKIDIENYLVCGTYWNAHEILCASKLIPKQTHFNKVQNAAASFIGNTNFMEYRTPNIYLLNGKIPPRFFNNSKDNFNHYMNLLRELAESNSYYQNPNQRLLKDFKLEQKKRKERIANNYNSHFNKFVLKYKFAKKIELISEIKNIKNACKQDLITILHYVIDSDYNRRVFDSYFDFSRHKIFVDVYTYWRINRYSRSFGYNNKTNKFKIDKNDWFDMLHLTYLKPGDKFYTFEKSFIKLIIEAGHEDILVY